MATKGKGFAHIPGKAGKALCGAVYRKPTHVRPETCPQCARVQKRGK